MFHSSVFILFIQFCTTKIKSRILKIRIIENIGLNQCVGTQLLGTLSHKVYKVKMEYVSKLKFVPFILSRSANFNKCWITHWVFDFPLGTIHLRRRQIFTIFDPYPPPIGIRRHFSKMTPSPPKKTSALGKFAPPPPKFIDWIKWVYHSLF